jgi:hypothetical protein
MITAT